MPTLSRSDILALADISTKTITVPDSIPVWGGMDLIIKQLTRGQQDTYLKRQFGAIRSQQDMKAKKQEITDVSIYGHDAWLCVCGICEDETGKPMFTEKDIAALNSKSGEAIGWIASEIVKFSGMDAETRIAKGESSAEAELSEDIKN